MSAMEKVAWTEILVSVGAVLTVAVIVPFLGNAATSAFALLALVVCGAWFIRGSRKQTHVDERDREIERHSKQRAVESAWWFLVLALIAIIFWPSTGTDDDVLREVINWLIWIQFAIFLFVKGLVSIISYRKQRRAS